jgi:hypothetical protein
MHIVISAARYGYTESAEVLLEYDGIDFTIKNDEGKSPMDYIAEMKKQKLVFGGVKERRDKFFALVDAYIAAGRAKAV